MSERGEYFENSNDFNVSHLFNKHNITSENSITIKNIDLKYPQKIEIKIKNLKKNIEGERIIQWIKQRGEYEDIRVLEELKEAVIDRMFELAGQPEGAKIGVSQYISSQGKLSEKRNIDKSDSYELELEIESNNEPSKTLFITSSSLTAKISLKLFNQIVLTPEEDLVYQALQIIEPNIERIAPIGNEITNNNSRSGFFVRLKDTQKRIPIGSMGDGIWRMLGLSLALVSAKDGVLLVDEIDTGLHYTALEDMWKLIWETSKKLNVQVFATTHNSDCWKALEALTSREDVGEEDISIQRIEKDAPRSVAYNKEEIATAVEREIEVR